MRARGRMLAWRITQSRKLSDLSGPWPMLLYTWLIPHCDNLGRFHGEPEQVKAAIFPRMKQVTAEFVVVWLQELSDAGLILWYEVDGMRFLSIPIEVWKREQKLHPNMSRTSDLPSPPDNLRTMSGGPTEDLQHEGKGRGSRSEVEEEEKEEGKEKGKGTGKPQSAINIALNTEPGPAFWNSSEVQVQLARLKHAGSSDEDARLLVLNTHRARERVGG